MILKSTLRLIKSTLNRFVAIFAIVFIGVSFMMGLRSTYDVMVRSVDDYIEETNLYDIQIYSNYGFDENDKEALLKQDNIDEVYASKTRDVYAIDKGGTITVARILELETSLNNFELVEGNLPTKANECLVVQGFNGDETKIGDKFEFYLNDEELKDSLKNQEFVVSGIAKSSEFISWSFPMSLLDNKALSYVFYVPNDNFIAEYYTTLIAKVAGSEDYSSFDSTYESFIDENVESLESFAEKQSKVRKDSIVAEANEELEKARKEFNDEKAKYEKEIADGKIELDKAKKQLDDAKATIEYAESEIPRKEEEIKQAEKQIEDAYNMLVQKESELNTAIGTIEKYGMTPESLSSLLNNIYTRYQKALETKNSLDKRLDDLFDSKIEADNIVINSGYNSSVAVYIDMLKAEKDSEEYQRLRTIYDAFKVVNDAERSISALTIELTIVDDTIRSLNNELKQKVGMDVEEGYAYLSKILNDIVNGRSQIEAGYKEIERNKRLIADGKIQIQEAKKQLEDGKIKYEEGLKEYNNGLKEYNNGVIKFKREIQNAEDKLADAEKEIENLDEIEWTLLSRYNSNSSLYMYKNNCDQMKSIGTIVPVFFFIVAALVCATTMTRLITEQRIQIGIYSALGFTKIEIICIYLLYVIFASLLAAVIAIFVGILVFPPIIYNVWRILYDLPKIHLLIPLDNLIICVLSFTILMLIVTFVVLYKNLKEESAELLRIKPPKYSKNIALEKIEWLWNKLSFTSKVTMRNLFRYKFRFFMTIVGVAGCAALLLLGFGIKDSISDMVTLQFDGINRHNYIVNLKNDRHLDEILESIKTDSNNKESYPYSSYGSKVEINDAKNSNDKYINVVVLNSDNQTKLYEITDAKTNKAINIDSDGAYITEKFAKLNNININDEITIESINGKKSSVKITGILKNYIQHYLYLSENYYKDTFDEDIEYNVIGINNYESSPILNELKDNFNDIVSCGDYSGSIEYFTKMIQSLNLIILIIIICAGSLAFVVLINLTNVNISERIREIATLKVLGFRQTEVNSYIFKEVVLMSIIGSIIGLPLGKLAVAYVMRVISMDMVMFPIIVSPISYVIAFSITMVFTFIVLLFTRKTLHNIEMVESLKTIE